MLALSIISSILITQFWIDIYSRCVELTKSAVTRGWGDKIFSKIFMCPTPTPRSLFVRL